MINGTTLPSSSSGRRRGGGLGGIEVRDGMLRIASYAGAGQQQHQQQSDGNGTTSHDGVYQCVASSPSGTIVSAEATLETACKADRLCVFAYLLVLIINCINQQFFVNGRSLVH
jgi:hypothetical protein